MEVTTPKPTHFCSQFQGCSEPFTIKPLPPPPPAHLLFRVRGPCVVVSQDAVVLSTPAIYISVLQ